MATQYPIEYKRGKLVKHLKPNKPYLEEYRHSKRIDKYNSISLSELMEWVNENGGEYNKAILEIEGEDHYDDAHGVLLLTVPLTQLEKDKLEFDYQTKLADWNEWKELSKNVVKSEEDKEKEKRVKSLKTQENNLLKQIARIKKQQQKIQYGS